MRKVFTYVLILFLLSALGIGAVTLYVVLSSRADIIGNIANLKKAQAIIVPGAGILENGEPTEVLRDRADKAIDLYRAGVAPVILVSGDNSTDLHNEVNPVQSYLISKGVATSSIYLDHAGFDTYSTMYRVNYIFGVTSAVVVSQSFHLPRAVFLGKHLGIKVQGVSADTGIYLYSNYVRECFADIKAVLNLLTHRQPKFLGEKIPIGK